MSTVAQAGTVAITGAARGIGFATAKRFTELGWTVYGGDIDGAEMSSAATRMGGSVNPFRLDVTDRSSFETFLGAVVDGGDDLDVLVNNAGVMPAGAFVDEDDATTATTLAVNVTGPILGCKLALPRMLDRGHGHVINVASLAGKVPVQGLAVYCASKHAVVGLDNSLREELRGTGVTLTTIMPTAVRTRLASGIPLDNLFAVEPGHVAEAIVQAALKRTNGEVAVPRALGAYEPAAALLPAPLMGIIRKVIGADRIFTSVRHDERAAYEESVHEQARA